MTEIQREDVRLRKSDEGPVLEIGETEILLRTFLKLKDETDRWGEREVPLTADIDCEGDNGCWWNLNPENGDLYPWITIQPELKG